MQANDIPRVTSTSDQVEHFVYELRDPRSKSWHPETLHLLAPGLHPQTFYVGKSNTGDNRLRRHVNTAKLGKHPCHRCHVIKQILAEGLMPELVIIKRYPSESEAMAAEARHAARYPAERLTNILEAGTTGWSPSTATRAKISAGNKGKIPPPHVREAQRLAATGRPKTLQELKLLRAAMKGRVFTPEHRLHLSEAYARRGPEGIEKVRKALKGRRTKLTAEGEVTLIEMHLRGCSSNEIGKVIGLSQGHTSQVVIDMIEVGRLPRRITHVERMVRAAEIYNTGGEVMDVVAALGLGAKSSGYAILQAASRAGLVARQSPYRKPHKVHRATVSDGAPKGCLTPERLSSTVDEW